MKILKDIEMQPEIISKNINDFYHLCEQPHHRYKSWEHCYKYFHNNKESLRKLNVKLPEEALLQLGFYLASWGMYRGSAFLLQNDYTVFDNLLSELLNPKYEILWCWGDDDINTKDKTVFIRKLLEANSTITRILEQDTGYKCTDTLTTKILMGIYGCVPAYDTYVKTSLKELNICQTVNAKSLDGLFEFYFANKIALSQNLTLTIDKTIRYPIMKKIDMAFFVKK